MITYLVVMLGGILGVAAAFAIPEQWSVSDQRSQERIYFLAFTKVGAKRKAKKIMRKKGWTSFRLRHHV